MSETHIPTVALGPVFAQSVPKHTASVQMAGEWRKELLKNVLIRSLFKAINLTNTLTLFIKC